MNLPLDLNLPSEQEMIEAVYDHFVTKGNAPSYITTRLGYIICLYRGPQGEKCAFGLFIPDELYTPEMENQDPTAIVKMHESSFGRFCCVLQACHDNAVREAIDTSTYNELKFRESILANLTQFARSHNLTLPA